MQTGSPVFVDWQIWKHIILISFFERHFKSLAKGRISIFRGTQGVDAQNEL